MATLKEALDQLAKGHELDNEQKKLIIDKWQKELGIQPCEDAISRQAALDIYDDYNVAVENGELEAYRKHRQRLLKLPTVTPKLKVGRWIDRNAFLSRCACSECGFWSDMYNYCPNCGARMIEPQESEGKE